MKGHTAQGTLTRRHSQVRGQEAHRASESLYRHLGAHPAAASGALFHWEFWGDDTTKVMARKPLGPWLGQVTLPHPWPPLAS